MPFSFPSLWQRTRYRDPAESPARRRLPKPKWSRSTKPAVETLENRIVPSVYSSGDVNLAIPDQGDGNLVSTINVPDSITIGDINVTLDINHTRDKDLEVFLAAPDGTRVELFTDVGGNGNNFSGTILDDEAATPITSGSAPFGGSYQPEGSLGVLDGNGASGDWKLEITDDQKRETGTLISWSIEITTPQPSLSIDDVQLAEGDSGTTAFVFTVTRSGDITSTSSVDFATSDGTASAGADYVIASGTLQFLANEINKTITVQVNGDIDLESGETFFVELTNPTNAVIADGQGQGTILDDDAAPGLISYWSADNTAVDIVGGNDGTLVSGASYGTGQFGQAFVFDGIDDRIIVADDPSLELTESMTIEGWVRVDSYRESGGGLILFRGDDRGGLDPYQLTASNGEIQFKINSLTSGASVGAAVPENEFVHVAATLDDATGEMNLYLNGLLAAESTTAVRPFGPLDPNSNPGVGIGNHGGYPSTPHNFPFHGAIDELKVYDVALSASDVLDNYAAAFGGTIVVIDDVQVFEGDSGTTALSFTVTRAGDTSGTASVDFTTADATALAGSDYVATSGTLQFLANETSKTITVQVNGDSAIELNETFEVNLSNAIGAVIAKAQGQGTIIDDDGYPVPDDPLFSSQWNLENTGQTGGLYDADIDARAAWSVTTGSMSTIVAIMDNGVDYTHEDLYLNMYLNQGEIPAALALVDTDADGLITFRDLNDAANASFVTDFNGTGYIDGGDLLADPAWADGNDNDGNSFTDDLIGWDFHDNDNNPMPEGGRAHGTGQAGKLGAISNNGVGMTGVIWSVQMIPIRMQDATRDTSNAAAGLNYAVAEGATISSNSWGDNTYSQVMYDAIASAQANGHLFVAAAGNQSSDTDTAPFFPAAYDLDNIISVAAVDHLNQLASFSNYGLVSVDVGAPSPNIQSTSPGNSYFSGGGTSSATPHVSGVAALLRTAHPSWTYSQIKDQILSTVDPLTSMTGKTVAGGRLNAAAAVSASSIHISDPSIAEGGAGTTGTVFTVSRRGDTSQAVTLDWYTTDGTATAGSDYLAASGTLNFVADQTTKDIVVSINGDLVDEGDETFFILLSNSSNGLLADTAGQGTILNDETPISIDDVTVIEGDDTAHYRGAFVNDPVGVNFLSLTFGPDVTGDGVPELYTSSQIGGGAIDRYDGTTGEFVDRFIPSGLIIGVRDPLFRDGYLYVGDEYTDEVLRFDAATGDFDKVFVTAGSGGIDGPHGMTFGPDANGDGVPELYVSGRNSANVVRYDGVTGQPLGSYVTSGSGGLSLPEGITFDPAESFLFVASSGSGAVLKYDALTGAFAGIGASSQLNTPKDVIFGTDGLMYVASAGNDRIIRFTADGTFVDDFVPPGVAGMDDPNRMAFSNGDLFVSGPGIKEIMRFGVQSEAVFTVSLASASALPVSADFTTADGTAAAGSDYTSVSGTLTFAPGVTKQTILVPILDDGVEEVPPETFFVNLSNATGAAISDGQGQATINDDDSVPPGTKFFVVDTGTDQTFEYDAAGGALASETWNLNGGNSSPVGASASADGSTVWSIDADKTVYVYDGDGNLQGSWGAKGGLKTPQGIASDGTDIWIVDANGGKVFRYSSAAASTSGNQGASASFSLAAGSPTGITTDGASVWIVDNSTDQVYRYDSSGALLGSWALQGHSNPTGVTIDPSGSSSSIWVVDNGTNPAKVYEYHRLTGAPQSSFVLAAGNTNPQGIADPPPSAAPRAETRTIPFKVNGSGPAPDGIPLIPLLTAPHQATGIAAHLGLYSGEGLFQLLSFTSPTTGTFQSAEPFIFTAANGDQLAFHYGRTDYGAQTTGTFEIFDAGDGLVYVVFDAEFTPIPELSTGRFKNVAGGSFRMIATTEAFSPVPNELGYTEAFLYSWVGEGIIEFANGKGMFA